MQKENAGLNEVQRNPGSEIEFCSLASLKDRLPRQTTAVIADSRVHALYGKFFEEFPLIQVPAGEPAKSYSELLNLYKALAEMEADRSWTLLALGGGSTSDLAGFAAHTWMRGVRLLVAPTTLLAMTDASLGGKNGIDLEGYKNLVGSFHFPEIIYCDIDTLYSLDAGQFSSGMAEVIKHAVLQGESTFAFLESLAEKGRESSPANFPAGIDRADMLRMVRESQAVKLNIVARDPKEQNERRLLNLGHTFGHAIEKVTGALHGHSVAVGMVIACDYAVKNALMDANTADRIKQLLAAFDLPANLEALGYRGGRKALSDAIRLDKKRGGSRMNFVVPRKIGLVEIHSVDIEILTNFIEKEVS